MTQAVVARKHGDDFQARLFWLHAALLLDPRGPVVRVGYEIGPKAFDDVLVEYDLARAPQDHHGQPVLRDHLQTKWHVKPGEFTYADLTDPAFTNATSQSFLQRARDAQVQHAPDGTGASASSCNSGDWSLVLTGRCCRARKGAIMTDSVYLRCVACGWVHCAATEADEAFEVLERCFKCGGVAFEVVTPDAAPRGVTILPLRWPQAHDPEFQRDTEVARGVMKKRERSDAGADPHEGSSWNLFQILR
jgi:hypothetical protein